MRQPLEMVKHTGLFLQQFEDKMAMLTSKPDSGDILSVSQVNLKDNFDYLRTSLNKDHIVDFSVDSSDALQGRHKQVSFNNRAFASLAVPAGTEGLVHVFNGNIYWRSINMPSSVQLSNDNVGTPLAATSGYSFLPGGLMIAWGKSAIVNGNNTIAYPKAGFSSNPSVTISPVMSSALPATRLFFVRTISSQTNLELFSGYSTGDCGFVQWIAIGPK